MTRLRKLALAGWVIAAASLSLAAATAPAATSLCATGTPEEALCGEGAGKKLSGASIALTSTDLVLTTSLTNITCGDSAMTVKPATASSKGVIEAEVTALSFSGCKTASGTACTFTPLNLPNPATIAAGSEEGKGMLTITDPSGAGFTVQCGSLVACTFSANEAILEVANGLPTTVTAANEKLNRSGKACPETAEWDATYATTSPAGLTLKPVNGVPTPNETALCATGSPESALCGEGAGKKLSSASIELTATNPLLTNSIANVSCGDSAMTVKPGAATSEGAIAAEVTALTFGGSCKTGSGTACTVTVVNLPYPSSIESSGQGKSTLAIEDPAGAGFKVVCGFLINCTFTSPKVSFVGTNGAPTNFVVSSLPLGTSGGFCPATASFDGSYSVSEPAGFTVL